MKMILLIAICLTFCGCALYPNELTYKSGQWVGLATHHQVARIQQDKLAMEKLKQTPAKTGTEADKIGFEGLVCNLSNYTTYNFVVSGPETRSYLLQKNECIKDNLIPGTYAGSVYRDGYQQGQPWVFHVNARQHFFKGEKVHWYLYKE